MNWSNWVESEFDDLHPEKYARDALHYFLLFEKADGSPPLEGARLHKGWGD